MHTIVFTAALVLAVPLAAQQSALGGIAFKWTDGDGEQTQTGFAKASPEIDRYSTLKIDVPNTFADAAAGQLSANAAPSPLVDELNAFKTLAEGLKTYTDAITVAAGNSPGKDISLDPQVVAARRTFAQALMSFRAIVLPIDKPIYDLVATAFTRGYPAVAQALQQAIDQLNARLLASSRDAGALGMTATIVDPEADARPLHLPGYDNNAQAAVAAVPNFIPVADDRTLAEAKAAQTLADVTKQLGKVGPELQKSVQQLQQALDSLRTTLKTDVLEKQLTQLETDLRSTAAADVPLINDVEAARSLVQSLNAANLTLAGTSDMDKLLGVANSLTDTGNTLIAAARSLPGDLQKLATDLEAVVKKDAAAAKAETIATLKAAATNFKNQQTFFVTLAGNIKSLADQFSANNDAALSAERLASTALSIAKTPELSTSLDLSRISGDVHVRDRIVIQTALYRRNDDGSLQPVEDAQQSFTVQRYGVFPENIRAGLLLVQPRSKIERKISYQPVPALGYYWRYGSRKYPAWNAISPSIGFTITLLDFQDANDVELGFAAGTALFRDLVWVGYGRNLQAKANYVYFGVNPLLAAKSISNR